MSSSDNFMNLEVTTTNKEKFTGEESALMAALIHKRFGRNDELALDRWQELLGNNCSMDQFLLLVQAGNKAKFWGLGYK
jgi:hypothetical protein